MGITNRSFVGFSQQDWGYAAGYEQIPQPHRARMSPKRLIMTVISLLLGIFLCYCSLFYIPAYFSGSQSFLVSTNRDLDPSISGEPVRAGWFTPYLDLLRVKRGYFKAGQTIEAEYVLSKEGDFVISITRCTSRPILEIFSCKPSETIEYVQTDTMRGQIRLKAPSSGFYNVSEYSVLGPPSDLKYAVIWRRG